MSLFPEVKLHLADGKEFSIIRSDDYKEKKSQKTVKPRLNGKKVKGTTIRHSDIMQGGKLSF
jgi:putative alpha-1,2-mannosidase